MTTKKQYVVSHQYQAHASIDEGYVWFDSIETFKSLKAAKKYYKKALKMPKHEYRKLTLTIHVVTHLLP